MAVGEAISGAGRLQQEALDQPRPLPRHLRVRRDQREVHRLRHPAARRAAARHLRRRAAWLERLEKLGGARPPRRAAPRGGALEQRTCGAHGEDGDLGGP